LDLPGKPDPLNRPAPPDKDLHFESLYKQNCAGCHGADGQFGPAPPLNDPIFLAIVTNAELRRVVTDGRHGTPMPAFDQTRGGPLTQAQIHSVTAGLKLHWGPGKAPSDVPPYAAGSSRGDAAQGRAVFARACAACHGPEGHGAKEAGAIHNIAFLRLISDQALRRLAITGRPDDLGMPNFAGPRPSVPNFKPLTSQEIADLVALLASWRAESPDHIK
jgi:mono/diheme cytochrome c family protein